METGSPDSPPPASTGVEVMPLQAPVGERFRFTGTGGEYFRIWMVNIALTVLTLGVYSAWAKVRRLQYFYRHTEVAGASFDYHGKPLSILYGRIVALVLLAGYNLSEKISMVAAMVAFVVLALVFPWLLRNSFRFRMRYSSYSGLRFSFRGSFAQAYRIFLPFGLLSLLFLLMSAWVFDGRIPRDQQAIEQGKLTIFMTGSGLIVLAYGLLLPLMHQRLKNFQHGKAWFGQTPFSFYAAPARFYAIYGKSAMLTLGVFVVLVAAVAGLSFAAGKSEVETGPDKAMLVLIAPFYFALFAVLGAYFSSRIGNLVWNTTMLGGHRFDSTLRLWPLMGIMLSNLALVIITAGFFMPWAAVRLARYRADNLTLLPAGSLDEFLASPEQEIGAVGEEAMDLFDFDIGL